MKVAIGIGGAASGDRREWADILAFAVESDRLGVDFCWSAEAWGQDCIAPLAFVAARTERMRLGTGIMQISARAPSMAAMTAMTMAAISDDRFVLGLGVSGPQVVEGLHGAAFDHPVARLSEYLDILELAFAGETIRYEGEHYRLPRLGGEGKALRLAQRAEGPIPVYLATLAPRGLELTGTRADGWVGSCFIPEASSSYLEPIQRGLDSAGRSMGALDLQAGGPVIFADDLQGPLLEVKRAIGFRLGAMGSRQHNFYNRAYQRAGFAEEAQRVQALWLDGRRDEATTAVTDEMALLSSFIGTDAMVKERVRAFGQAGITTVRAEITSGTLTERLATLERFLDCVRAADAARQQ